MPEATDDSAFAGPQDPGRLDLPVGALQQDKPSAADSNVAREAPRLRGRHRRASTGRPQTSAIKNWCVAAAQATHTYGTNAMWVRFGGLAQVCFRHRSRLRHREPD